MKNPCKEQVFRTVVLEQTDSLQVTKHGDIIAFYNQAFMPRLKSFLMTMQRHQQAIASGEAEGGGAAGHGIPTSPVRVGTGAGVAPSPSPGGSKPHPMPSPRVRPPDPFPPRYTKRL
eukprot:1193137-Prorocentrum_minimum.AAC.2